MKKPATYQIELKSLRVTAAFLRPDYDGEKRIQERRMREKRMQRRKTRFWSVSGAVLWFLAVCALSLPVGEGCALAKEPETEDVYQKLKKQEPVRIACLGDSIAEGAGMAPGEGFVPQLKQWMQETYQSPVGVDSYAAGGSTAFFGYYRCKSDMQENVERYGAYDLVLICYGQNDLPDHFSLIYEALLRAVRQQNPDCQIICLLEHSQRDYTDKIEVVKALGAYYGTDIADTIEAYRQSPYSYEQLCQDSVHPNILGHQIYRETIGRIIEQNVKKGKKRQEMPLPVNADVGGFENFTYLSLSKCRPQGKVYTIELDKPTVGIFIKRAPESRDVHIKLSNGTTWDFRPAVENVTVPFAELIGIRLPPGTKITLDNSSGEIQNTVYGFVLAG